MLMRKAVSLTAALLLSALALLFADLCRRRAALPYNEEGRFFDAQESVVYKDSSVVAYGGLALLFALATFLAVLWAIRAWRR